MASAKRTEGLPEGVGRGDGAKVGLLDETLRHEYERNRIGDRYHTIILDQPSVSFHDNERWCIDGVEVIRVTDPECPDLAIALDLYGKRIEIVDQWSPEEVVTWLRDPDSCLNAFLVARTAGEVCGFLVGHFYRPYFLVAYLVTRCGNGLPVALSLCKAVRKWLENVEGHDYPILFELEDPNTTRDPDVRKRRQARLRRFAGLAAQLGHHMRVCQTRYRQPCLDEDESTWSGVARDMLLCGIFTKLPHALSSADFDDILRVLYLDIYARGSVGVAGHAWFKEYMARFYEQERAAVPASVPLSTIKPYLQRAETGASPGTAAHASQRRGTKGRK